MCGTWAQGGLGGFSSYPPATSLTTAAQEDGAPRGEVPTPLTSSPLLGAERVHEELTRELGAGRAPGLGDRARLPYTDAVLHEAQRLLALVPMGIPRALTKTTCFRGYTLPQVSLQCSHAQ